MRRRAAPSRTRPWDRARRAGVIAVLAMALAMHGCQRPATPPSVVWIVVDTLRADHLEWYGYERETSPELAALVGQSVLFEHAYTPQPQTAPAIASMFTGLYPARHGVRQLYVLLHDANLTAAETFAAAGYETAAFVSSFVMIRDFSNLAQGFAVYDDFVDERELYRENYERKAAGTLAVASRWLEERDARRPFFLFIHLIDPHGPYAPPGRFAERFRADTVVEVTAGIPAIQQIPGVRDLNRYRDLYDGEIAYASTELGAFLARLREKGWYDDSLVLLTADHGESMGEHGVYFDHGHDVFQENVRVPLIVKPPRGFHGVARRVPDPVSLVDLLPTVLELAGLERPERLDGRSLAPLLRGETLPPAEIFAETRTAWTALVAGGSKTVGSTDPTVQAVTYELARDPAERAPAAADDRRAGRLRAWNERWARVRLPFSPVDNFLAPEMRGEFVRRRPDPRRAADVDRLRSLGYVN